MSVNRDTISNLADYSSPGIVKKLLYSMDKLLHEGMWKGDVDAITVYIDLKTAINTKGVLTFKQRRYLLLWIEGYTQEEIGAMYRVARHGISMTVDKGIKNISNYLTP